MKLETIDNRYIIYHITNIKQFDTIESHLSNLVKSNRHDVISGLPLDRYLSKLRESIKTDYKKFFLIVALDKELLRVAGFIPCYIVGDITDENKCLINWHFRPGTIKIILPTMLHHINAWAKEFNYISMYGITTRAAKPYAKLLKPYGFEWVTSVFERKAI